jgi:hypothetical protein
VTVDANRSNASWSVMRAWAEGAAMPLEVGPCARYRHATKIRAEVASSTTHSALYAYNDDIVSRGDHTCQQASRPT